MADIITKIHFHFPIRKSTIQKKLQRKKKPKKKDKSKQFANVNEKIQKTIKNYFNLKDIKCCYFYSIGSSIPFHQQKITNIKKKYWLQNTESYWENTQRFIQYNI